MKVAFKHVLLFSLLSLLFCGRAIAEFEQGNSQKIISAPDKDGIKVIDGSGTENLLLHERKGGSRVSVSTVAVFTLAMAAATGLGAVPFFFVELDPQWAGICNGMASGVMLSASFDLIQEGQEHGAGNWVVIGILAGGIFIWLCKKVMDPIFLLLYYFILALKILPCKFGCCFLGILYFCRMLMWRSLKLSCFFFFLLI